MKVKASDLRHVVTIQNSSESADEIGGHGVSWNKAGIAWAHIEPVSMNEAFIAHKLGYTVTHRIIIRQDISITPHKNRIVYGDRTFEILAVSDPYETGEFFELKCMVVG